MVLSKEQYLTTIAPEPFPLVIASVETNDIVERWPPPPGWWYQLTCISKNGKFAAVFLGEEDERSGADWKNPRYKVGLIDVGARQLDWVGELSGQGDTIVNQMSVSNDGRYIAVTGWYNEVALVDTSARELLWTKHPPDAVASVFSSDGQILYAGDGGGGGVYAFESRTGNVIGRWHATTTGEDTYGHRISCMAISPDDGWIAAGTGPEGQVFLFSTAAPGGKPVLLPHGYSTILIVSFSPDSKYVASLAKGRIKIWAVAP